MSHLTSVDVLYGSTLDVLFSTDVPLLNACETAVLQLATSGHPSSELGIRIERGVIVDFYIWDAGRRLRQRLPAGEVTINGHHISCVIPAALLPVVHGTPRLEAALVVNGAAVQSRFPVRILSPTAPIRQRVLSRSKF